jgi:hypothetical protein
LESGKEDEPSLTVHSGRSNSFLSSQLSSLI